MPDISSLSIEISNPRASLPSKLQKICRTVKSRIPQCHRVGIWLFSEDYQEMTQLTGLDENNVASMGDVLKACDFQPYFDHIINNSFLVANNARSNPASMCFNKSYFEQYDIYSLLDYTFSHDFNPLGVICCEHTHEVANWTEEDKAVLKRIASVTSTFLAENVSKAYNYEARSALIEKLA